MKSAPNDPGQRKQVTVPLLRRESIGDLYHVLTFDMPEGVQAKAGQFVMVRGAEWGDAPLLPRPMSYLTAGTRPSILIKVFGEGTTRMARAEPGEPFTLLGPLGNGWSAVKKKPVLVGGGVGIAPLLYLARDLAEAGTRPVVIYGGRGRRDLPLENDLKEISELHVTTEDGSVGNKGRVTDILAGLIGPEHEVFTCGPDRMMAKVAEICAEQKVPCEASLETPMACGFGVCLGCPVRTRDGQYLYTCTQGPCLDAETIDWGAGGHAPLRTNAGGAS